MIYLASPYTHPDPVVREERFRAVCRLAADIMRCGIHVFSPIAHSHPIAKHGLPLDWEFWREYNFEFLRRCSALWVLMLDGWQESEGVQAEIKRARELGMQVMLIRPEPMCGCNVVDDCALKHLLARLNFAMRKGENGRWFLCTPKKLTKADRFELQKLWPQAGCVKLYDDPTIVVKDEIK